MANDPTNPFAPRHWPEGTFDPPPLTAREHAAWRMGAEALREAVLARLPGGTHCDPQDIADAIRALPLPTPPAAMEGGKDE